MFKKCAGELRLRKAIGGEFAFGGLRLAALVRNAAVTVARGSRGDLGRGQDAVSEELGCVEGVGESGGDTLSALDRVSGTRRSLGCVGSGSRLPTRVFDGLAIGRDCAVTRGRRRSVRPHKSRGLGAARITQSSDFREAAGQGPPLACYRGSGRRFS